jgi:hypothetical protein
MGASPCEPSTNSRVDQLRKETYQDLLALGGPLLTGAVLRNALGIPSATAFKRAWERGHLGVHTFRVPHRRGRFALARDVADWLIESAYGRPISTRSRSDEEKTASVDERGDSES